MTKQPVQASPQAYGYPLLIKQLLHASLAASPQQEIVYGTQRRHSYVQFHQRVQQLGNLLRQLGVAPGATVAVMDWDSHRYLECFFAVPMLGSVLQTVNIRLSPEQILYTLNHAQADVIFINTDFLEIFSQIRGELTTAKTFVLLNDTAQTGLPEGFAGEYEDLLAQSATSCDFPDFDENTRATTFYTTGTTGLPKGVFFSHRQLVLHTLAVTSGLALAPQEGRLHREDVYMPLTPMFHVHAWGMPYVATMIGLKQVYPGRYVPDTILHLIAAENVTFSHCVPTILHMVLNAPAAQQTDLSKWKMIIGGSAMTSSLAQAAMARGIDVFTGYGMSESCPILSFSQVDSADLGTERDLPIRVKTGRPIPLVALRTVDADMQDCPHDGKSTGEVVARAPWLTQGYLHNPQASDELWAGGWLHTQDIGYIDSRGYLQVTDRIKDVIKTGGEWVSSLEIEEIIARHPAVAETAVVGIKDLKWGERPLALVVLRAGYAGCTCVEDIRAHVLAAADAGHISRYGVPDRIDFVTELTRTSVGKLNKRAMREQYPS